MTDAVPETPAAPPGEPALPAAADATISFEKANVLAMLFLPVALAPVAAHGLVRGWGSLGEGVDVLFPWLFLPLFLVSIALHEALHAVGFLAGGAPRPAMHFGVDRKTLSPFAGCRAPLRASAYRLAIALPALGLGVLPSILGVATGAGWLTLWGAFMLFTAGGDFAALWAMRSVPSRARVLDHPERVGCRILADE